MMWQSRRRMRYIQDSLLALWLDILLQKWNWVRHNDTFSKYSRGLKYATLGATYSMLLEVYKYIIGCNIARSAGLSDSSYHAVHTHAYQTHACAIWHIKYSIHDDNLKPMCPTRFIITAGKACICWCMLWSWHNPSRTQSSHQSDLIINICHMTLLHSRSRSICHAHHIMVRTLCDNDKLLKSALFC